MGDRGTGCRGSKAHSRRELSRLPTPGCRYLCAPEWL